MNESIDYKPLIEDTSSEEYYKQFKNVYIHCNNEVGYYIWSVVSEEYECYWINSYNTKKEAIDLCNKYCYKITRIINDKN